MIMILLILIFGFIFGAILQYARLNRFNVISGLATLEDLTVAKTIVLTIGLGAINFGRIDFWSGDGNFGLLSRHTGGFAGRRFAGRLSRNYRRSFRRIGLYLSAALN